MAAAAEGLSAAHHGLQLLLGNGAATVCSIASIRRSSSRAARHAAGARSDSRHHRYPGCESDRKRGASIDPVGYDAGKKTKGIKRNAIIDTEGHLLAIEVIAANTQDRHDRCPFRQTRDDFSNARETDPGRALIYHANFRFQALRDKWLERLWCAIEDDDIPYIELLPDHWGELCVTPERASRWAHRFIEGVRLTWRPDLPRGGHFKGTAACLSALYAAGRHVDLLNLLDLLPYKFWHDRHWGVRALVAQGKTAAAIRYAEDTCGLSQPNGRISMACEEILLSEGLWREAYDRYALDANRNATYLATFQALTAKHPQIEPKAILGDLVDRTPGREGQMVCRGEISRASRRSGRACSDEPLRSKDADASRARFRSEQSGLCPLGRPGGAAMAAARSRLRTHGNGCC